MRPPPETRLAAGRLATRLDGPQIDEWADGVLRFRTDRATMAVLWTPEAAGAGRLLARALHGRPELPASMGPEPALLITVTALPSMDMSAVELLCRRLRARLEAGHLTWGVTGPRPNPVAAHCHDALAVPSDDPVLVAGVQRLLVRSLLRRIADRARWDHEPPHRRHAS